MSRTTLAAIGVLVALAGSPARAATDIAARPLPVPTSQPEHVALALELATRHRERAIAAWVEICETGALPREEAARARLVARLLTAAGLPALVLPDGNVEAVLAGSEPGSPAVMAAHLDALHAPGEGRRVRRDAVMLRGPGVLDDASGLAAMVAAAGALRESGYRPRREVRFVATVGEEIGLIGARSYLDARPDVAAFIAVDGILGRIEHGATGVRWTRWRLSGRGGHTLLSAHVPSPSIAAARAIAGAADLVEPTDALLNISGLRSGEAPNALPTDATFTTDLRSDDEAERQRLVRAIADVVEAAAAREGVTVRSELLQDLPAARIPGHERSRLVRGAADILRHLAIAPVASSRGSSDANVALLRGIPSIAVGATTGRNAHAPEEQAEIAPLVDGVRQLILLTVLVGEGLSDEAVAQ